jgi:hypothetical protein
MFAVVQNGEVKQVIQPNVAFTIGEKQYSARFFSTTTEAERKAIGVYEIIQGEQKDQRFYWVSGPGYQINEGNKTVTAIYTAIPKAIEDKEESDAQGNPLYVQEYDPAANNGQGAMVNSTERLVTKGLKSQWIAQTKQTAGSMLAQTDWMVIRKAERNIDIPAEAAADRAKIIADCTAKEAAIAACTTVEQLMAVV